MADPFTSALVSDVVSRFTSAAIQEVGLLWGPEEDLLALNNTFKQIQSVLPDAEKKQTTQKDVEKWLRTLKFASLEVENVFDEAKTEASIESLHNIEHKPRTFFSSHHNPLMVKTRIAHKVKKIRKKLEDIDANRSNFQLASNTTSEDGVGAAGKISNRETSSVMSKIYGRDEEKSMIVDKICNQDIGIAHGDDDVRVYAIWGVGGIGKTTLAQYVYNHETVKKCFELTFWVYVSDVFDVKQIIKQILKAIYGPGVLRLDFMSLETMQVLLQEKLNGKKYFLIMDDVSIENKDMEKWGELCKALSCAQKGSTVMVTTGKEETTQLMAVIPELQHHVGVLSEKDSWSLFEMLALPGRGEGGSVSSDMELVGREIVEKCKGLPLAVTTLGSLMTKKKLNEWQLVNDKFVLETQDNGILTALRLSYDDLVPHLKRCFAYCCLFSKGEEMSKDLLIELWIANDFIPTQGDVSLYVLGEEILSCLIRRSFIQYVIVQGYKYTGEICKMHDLMHDLAQYEMRHDCWVIGKGKELKTPDDQVRHLSLLCDYKFSKQDLRKLRSVRSMLVHSFSSVYTSNIRQISKHVYLRVLYLQGVESSTSLKSICKLIHLRYLKISRSNISVLPESIINLQNLQVLILELGSIELPKGLRYMRNLQHLDTGSSFLQHMPVGIKELTNLRRLSEFAVGRDDGAQIAELGNLNLLGTRKLRLSRLENVGGLRDAKTANLKDNTNLKSLELWWTVDRWEETCDEEEVLEGLEPNSGLQELGIWGYMGSVLSPGWLIKLVNLTSIKLSCLEKCQHLPPLGKLPSLKRIELFVMASLQCFHEDDNATLSDETLFSSLKELHIDNCWNLVSLPSNFPKLTSLKIVFCDKLRSLPDEIQSFKDLILITIEECQILSKRCEKEIGEDWLKISHIPHLSIKSRGLSEDEDEHKKEDNTEDIDEYKHKDNKEDEDEHKNGDNGEDEDELKNEDENSVKHNHEDQNQGLR